MSEVVVDASAVLALLNQETGSEEVSQFIGNAAISAVNLSEVIAKLADAGISEEDIRQILSHLTHIPHPQLSHPKETDVFST